MDEHEWLGELAKFLVENNNHGWAASEGEEEPIFPGWKRHVYRSENGLWVADDNYTGHFRAPGFTVINFKGRPGYMLQYGGPGQLAGYEGIAPDTFRFLRKALAHSTSEMPFRGPERFEDGEFKYFFNKRAGDIRAFIAEEDVYKRRSTDTLVFSQNITGSIVVPRDDKRNKVLPWNF